MLNGKRRKQAKSKSIIMVEERVRMMKLILRQRLEMVKGLLSGWCSREEEIQTLIEIYPGLREVFNRERLTGNVDLLSELLEQDFKDDGDMKRKVESWIEEREMSLRTQEEKREKYFKRKFERELKERCLSRYKRRKK